MILENIPELPPDFSSRLHRYENTRDAYVMGWLGRQSKGLLVSTRFGESAQLHVVEEAGGARQQLTFFREPILEASVCPDAASNRFLLAKDDGGNEYHQLFLYDHQNGHCQLLTDGSSKHGNGRWNHSGTAIVYSSTKRNKTDHDLYHHDLEQGERLFFEAEGYWVPISWSPDGQHITAINYRSALESALYIIDTASGRATPVVDRENVACRGGYWSNDGQQLYFTTDEGGEYRQLMCYDTARQSYHRIDLGIQAEVEGIKLAPNGGQLAVVLNQSGYSQLVIWDIAQRAPVAIPALPAGIYNHLHWHPDLPLLALSINCPQAPADAYVIDVHKGTLSRWTKSEAGGFNANNFIVPELLHYPTFDEVNGQTRHIPAFYFRPPSTPGPLPVLIYIHGGPESQYRPAFSPVFQYYLKELGIAILAPNVRGSSGYGKTYLRLDDGYKREDAVKDIGTLLDWIDQQPELDSSRIAVMGGSYGGYMVLSSMAHYSHRLCCGIDIVGISNFVTFLKNTKSYRRHLRRVEYGDERDPAMRQHLERISPTANAHKIKKPIMVVQGLNDPRVPASEAEQMVEAIRSNGGEAWYLLATDEGHGFRKKGNRDFFNKTVNFFLQQYLI